MKEISEAEMLHRAAAYCSASEHCIQEVEKKILNAGLSADSCNRIILRLLKEKFIDERRFARFFVNDKLRFNKWGRVKINYELQRKGISSEIRTEALNEIDDVYYHKQLQELMSNKKRITRAKDNRECYIKLLRFAIGRGFEPREIHPCLKRLFNNNSYDTDYLE